MTESDERRARLKSTIANGGEQNVPNKSHAGIFG